MGRRKGNRQRPQRAELPDEFFTRLELITGPAYSEVRRTFSPRPTTFRVNTLKGTRQELLGELRELGVKAHSLPWYTDAFLLQHPEKREFTELPPYREGKLYVQSLASMVPVIVLDPRPGERVLDLTAAPGSKTSQIAMMMERKGKLIANDNSRVRFFKLKHNMEHLGVAGEDDFFTLRLEDGSALCRELEAEPFDRILVDAPCSAEARFQEGDPRSFLYWRAKRLNEIASRQRRLLLSAWSVLKPGGTIVYSTCTFAPEENEVLLLRFLEVVGGEVEFLPIERPDIRRLPVVSEWKGEAIPKEIAQAMRIAPSPQIEGFFIAKLRKRAA